ncbi:MAG: hypothetical protein NUW01_13175 [Gemmatimonadaceae bacterium]|nr:hypothetical protein [Gemmatimonadaceae bacterium]
MKRVAVAVLSILSAACAPALKPLPPVDAELPSLPVERLSITTIPPAPGEPPSAGPRVTVSASQADVRLLIPALAQIAGVSVVLDSTVRGTVAVHFENVPAVEALLSVIDAAGLTIEGEPEKPWPESVFYQVPVNVNTATAGVIAARFGVSPKLAEFIVRSRRLTVPDR